VIRVCRYESAFAPHQREFLSVEHRKGMTLKDLGQEVAGSAEIAAWVNGELEKDLTRAVSDGEFVHVMCVPQGVGALLMGLAKFIVTGLIYGAILKEFFMEDPTSVSEEGDPYHGFRNNYRPEGEAIPVVYGKVRTSPPVLNQSVLGAQAVNQAYIIGRNENLNSMFAVSHGPILGFGDAQRDVYTQTDFNSHFSSGDGSLIKLQINGIEARHFDGHYEWRTGGGGQSPIRGLLGNISYTDPGTSYTINFDFPNGTAAIPVATTGEVAYGSRIQESDSTEYFRLHLATECDRGVVQILFPRGLYNFSQDSGNYSNNERTIQMQYWVTDSAGSAVPSTVMIMDEVKVVNDEPNMFSVDLPISFVSPTTVSGGGGSKGYALVDNNTSGGHRLYVSGTGTGSSTGEDLDLLIPGIRSTRETATGSHVYATFDQTMKFTFASWVKVPDWSGGFDGGIAGSADPPMAWLMHWSREASAGASWPFQGSAPPPVAQNLYLPGSILSTGSSADSFGMAICLCVDPLGIAPGNGSVPSDDPWVVLKLYTWAGNMGVDQAGHMGSEPGYMSCWVSSKLGRASQFADWQHVGLVYDQSTFSAINDTVDAATEATVKIYINGVQRSIQLQPESLLDSPESYDTGWVFGNHPTTGFYKNCRHVPVSFFADNKTVLRIGGWDNITNATPSHNVTKVGLAEYLFYDGDIEEDRPGWFSDQVNSFDDFGNSPIATVQTLVSINETKPHLRICCPFDNDEVVATNFYKNYAYPDGVDEAGGALRMQNTAITQTSGSAVLYPQLGVSTLNFYILEVFVDTPSEDETSKMNLCSLDTVTTWQNDEYSYPGIAVLSTSIQANDQIASSSPQITVEVHGKKVDVWDGESIESPTFISQWSSNPAWVSLDLLRSHSYGLGQIFAPDGTLENFDLTQFIEWATWCDEGVPDAYGSIQFFAIKTGSPTSRTVVLSFGLLDTANSRTQRIPKTWAVGKHLSIQTIVTSEVGTGFVTSSDLEGGLNNASNRLEITNIEFKAEQGGSHGWVGWCEVSVLWNRDTWPNGGAVSDPSTDPYPATFYADMAGVSYLGTASGYEYRCAFNGALTKKNQAAWDEILSVFGCGRAVPVKIGRFIVPVWDRPRQPVALVGQANIKEGSFTISYSDPRMAPNSMEMEILDADRNWQGQTVLVDHPTIQGSSLFQQVRKERVSLFGCTNRSQAVREGIYRLNKYVLSTRSAEFEVGPDCVHLLPGDRILVAHDVPDYGESGRLPVAMQIFNIHPGGGGIYESWNQQGGDCTISDRSLIESIAHATLNPPVINFRGGCVFAYSVPTDFGTAGQELGGTLGSSGRERTPTWAAQYVAVGSGLYPTPDYSGSIPISPLDRIQDTAKKVNFSVYVKQPAGYCGSSASFALVLYRLCDDGSYVKASHGAYFTWNGSGALTFGAYIGDNTGVSSPYGITYDISGAIAGGWYRVAITYDNDDTGAKTGAGATGVGDYLQARLFYNYPTYAYGSLPTFDDVSEDGRGNQFLYGGDPTGLELQTSASAYYWTGARVRGTTTGAKIVHDLTVAPPFYPNDTTSGSGTPGSRGYVLLYDHDTGVTTDPVMMSQQVDINFTGSSSPLVTSRANEPMCFTGYFRRHSASENASILINIRKAYTQSGTELYTADGGQVVLTYNGSSWSAANTTVGSGITINSSVAAVRLTDSTTDADWVQLNIDVTSSANFTQLGFQIGSNSSSGGNKRFYGWGFRLHGASDTSGSVKINPYPHQGTALWGAMYEPEYTGSGAPTTYYEGGQIQLDRDVTTTAGKTYEICMRSTFETDMNLNTDVIETVVVSSSEVPAVGTTNKAARSWLSVVLPERMYPRAGDLYSWGESNSATEDFIITDVSTDPDTLVRKIVCMEYDEDVYDDTSIADIVDPDVNDGPGPGGIGNWDGAGNQWDVTYGGLAFNELNISTQVVNYRTGDGITVPSIILRWESTSAIKKMPFKELRIWVTRLTDVATSSGESSYQYVASVPSGVNSYRYDNFAIQNASSYKFILQPVAQDGTARILANCPTAVAIGTRIATPIADAPTVNSTVNGFTQNYQVTKNTDAEVKAIEGRIGGWIISTPAFIVDPNTDRFDSHALLPVPTDSVGFTQGKVYARNKLSNGRYGKAVIHTGTEEFVDVSSSRQTIAENDYASSVDGSLDTNLAITSGVLHWNASSSSIAAAYYKLSELDATTARRTVVNAVIQGYQIRHETLADLNFTLGSDIGSNWSLEGPMQDDGGNAKVEIEWRWTSGSSITSVNWRTFEPGEVYARKVQFRLKFTRKNAGDDVRLERFTVKCNDVPSVNSTLQAIDGGTF
jgi:hypothetical protein